MDKVVTPFEALQHGVAIAGGQSATARICKVSQTAVWKWLQSGKRLPAEHVLPMSAATGISPHTYRPDIYPLSLVIEEPDYTEECGPVLTTKVDPVVCDHPAKAQRKDVA
ncbi:MULTISPECIES: YdaS family helix-turn-helix protein [unclassified Novosphingobium]|uniref:transcriptional regulator n=1 Tax=unclassified Novosphingobium TaxID=2644732 RepID=UPI00135C7C0D|nr:MULTISPECIES: YdaS family helix-turn-helix protein [unclassified Novosphingobium]